MQDEIIRINRNTDVIIPYSELTEESLRLRNIKHDTMQNERKMRNRSRNYIQQFGNLLTTIFM